MRIAGPRRIELRAEGDHHQRPQALRAFDDQPQELGCGRIDPVRVLIDGKDRLPLAESVELFEQNFDSSLLLSFWRQIREPVGWQRKHCRNEGRGFLDILTVWGEKGSDL